jgi:hypothetical protein
MGDERVSTFLAHDTSVSREAVIAIIWLLVLMAPLFAYVIYQLIVDIRSWRKYKHRRGMNE